MKTLRKLTSVIVLTLMLGLPAFSGETHTPPCAPPEPGETHTPPCSGTATGDMATATAADEAFTEIVTEVLESMLSIL